MSQEIEFTKSSESRCSRNNAEQDCQSWGLLGRKGDIGLEKVTKGGRVACGPHAQGS